MDGILEFDELDKLFQKALSDVVEEKKDSWSDEELASFYERAAARIQPLTDNVASDLFRDLRQQQVEVVGDWQRMHSDFAARHQKIWEQALSALHALIIASYEAGAAFTKRHLPPEPQRNVKLEVLVSLHARAVQVANEVLCLLNAGYADGAHARWRTAHEIAVTIDFLAHCSCVTAQKYLDHEAVESYKAVQQYQECAESLGLEPYPQEEVDELRGLRDEFAEKYGRRFLGKYGWAARKLGLKDPTFASLEKAVGIDHLRPYYKMASHNVHANPTGIAFRLGLSDGAAERLAGPSNFGLSDPGQNMAITLGQVNASLLLSRLSIDTLVYTKVVQKFVDLVLDEFAAVERQMREGAQLA